VDGLPDPGSFGAVFEDFMRAMTLAAKREESDVAERLREHLGVDPSELPTTGMELPLPEQANLQLALDAVLGDAEVLGFRARHVGYGAIGLNEVLAGFAMTGPISFGPPQHIDVEVGDGRVIRCLEAGVLLGHHDGAPVALVISRGGDHPMRPSTVRVEGVSPTAGAVSELLRALRAAMREHNVFRGRIISLHQHPDQSVSVQFHAVPTVSREQVVLPAGTLERLERHAIGIAESAERLRAAGRHLKRGVLLHGPPGTGKTLTVSYLLHAMPGRTTILLTGRGLGLIEQALAIGRELAPATFVFEDIDLVAAERTMPFMGDGGVLFELLNQVEGLAEDDDLLFLLTTNRPDVIEPALAVRPGRVDLALEIPLPDDDGRRRLLRLYGAGVELDESAERDLVTRSAGVSGAFVKELCRQAWLRSALDGREAPVAADLLGVLDDLLEERSTLTRRLLGRRPDGEGDGGGFASMAQALNAAGLRVPPPPPTPGVSG
jgi:ATPase family associated with various cellular activities (AAA)